MVSTYHDMKLYHIIMSKACRTPQGINMGVIIQLFVYNIYAYPKSKILCQTPLTKIKSIADERLESIQFINLIKLGRVRRQHVVCKYWS